METASQWPRPSGLDDQVDDPLVLVERFKRHYISICHHTADNPTATAPASYVMDIMFQANKVVTLLAKHMSAMAARQCVEANLAVDRTGAVVCGESPVRSEQIPPADVSVVPGTLSEGAGDLADNVIGTIDDYSWRDEDSEGDGDFEDDGTSEMDSEDEYFEFGDFGDINWELSPSGREQREAESRGGQGGGEQITAVQTAEEGPKRDTEEVGLCTILDTNWDGENSAEDQDYEDDGPSDHDSEDDYYEYGDFDDEEEQDRVDREKQGDPGTPVEQAVETPAEHAVPGNINDTAWGDEDSEADQDWEDNDSSDRDSEDDYYEYGNFEDDALEDEVQPANESVQSVIANGPRAETETEHGHEPSICANRSCWRDVYDWIPGLVIQEIPVRDSTTSLQLPPSPSDQCLKIRWGCAHPPYRDWSAQGLTHHDIIAQLHATLAESGLPELQGIQIQSIKPYNLSGDLEVHLATLQDRESLAEHAGQWLPRLKYGHTTRIPDIYYPERRVNADNISQVRKLPTRSSKGCVGLPGFRIRWRNHSRPHKVQNREEVVLNSIREQIHTALDRSGNPELQGIYAHSLAVGMPLGDIDLFFESYADRDMLYDNESLWVPHLEQGHIARIVLIHDPKEEPEPTIASAEQHTQMAPLPTIELCEVVPPLTIHWNSDPPYRAWEARGLNYEDIKTEISYALGKIIDPSLEPELPWSLDINSESGDINIHFNTAADRAQAVNNVLKWFPLIARSSVARIPGVYNPLRRAKSNAKLSRRSRSPQAESQSKGMDESILTVQDGANGVVKSCTREASPGPQLRGERQLERRRTKRRQKRWENKIRKNSEVLAC